MGIAVVGLEVSLGGQKILKGIDLQLKPGKILALLGPNGAGKSTCMRALAGLVFPQYGKVSLNGVLLDSFSALRDTCAYLIEGGDFYEFLSARQNLELMGQLGEWKVNVKNLLQQVGLETSSEKKVKRFSMGMKQRLGIAQALLSDPDYLILDEPFNGLDFDIKQDIMKLIRRLRDEGKGIMISTHLLEDIETLADEFVILDKGSVFVSGDLATFGERGQVATFFFEEPFHIPGIIGNVVAQSDRQVSIQTDRRQACQILEFLVAKGQVPYKIEWSGVLRDNYLKILSQCD